MIEEPYRWVEAVANRREYIEHQLAGGSPLVALTYGDGILFLTLGRERQKIFEIYDRIAMGALGHPGDIERLRMAAIEVASTEGFTRSAQDVSLRRLSAFSLSPVLKAAFEQIYGPPYLVRMLFGELGREGERNLFFRIDYDGSIHTNGGSHLRTFEDFGVISGTAASSDAMAKYLAGAGHAEMPLPEAIRVALQAWTIGRLTREGDIGPVSEESIQAERAEQLKESVVEAAVLERSARQSAAYRPLEQKEIDEALS